MGKSNRRKPKPSWWRRVVNLNNLLKRVTILLSMQISSNLPKNLKNIEFTRPVKPIKHQQTNLNWFKLLCRLWFFKDELEWWKRAIA